MPSHKKLVVRFAMSDAHVQELQRRFPNLRVVVCHRDEATFRQEIRDAHIVYGPVQREFFLEAPHLEYIHVSNQGVQWIHFPELAESGVIVTNAKAMWSPAMAEHVLMLTLALMRRLGPQLLGVRDGVWRTEAGPVTLLRNKAVLFLGSGTISQHCAALFRAFGCTLEAVSRSGAQHTDFDAVHPVNRLLDVIGNADVIVNCLPQSPETLGLVSAEVIAAMRPSAFFINVGRGITVDEEALIDALRDGRLAGAGLDVTREEPPPPGSPLWRMENVLLSGHTAGRGEDERSQAFALLSENIGRYLDGRPLLNRVDLMRGY